MGLWESREEVCEIMNLTSIPAWCIFAVDSRKLLPVKWERIETDSSIHDCCLSSTVLIEKIELGDEKMNTKNLKQICKFEVRRIDCKGSSVVVEIRGDALGTLSGCLIGCEDFRAHSSAMRALGVALKTAGNMIYSKRPLMNGELSMADVVIDHDGEVYDDEFEDDGEVYDDKFEDDSDYDVERVA